jgi:predicted glycogen debranching enzyme
MPEWLEADGAGGFASGASDLIRTRRYHALLLVQTPAGRVTLVNGIEAWVNLPDGPVFISSQRYAPDVIHPDGARRIEAFASAPWPRWTFLLPDGSRLTQEVFVAGGQTCLRWSRHNAIGAPLADGAAPATLHVRLLLSGRDYHALHHENPAFAFAAEQGAGWVRWRPYPGLPPITAWGGSYAADPLWYRQFLYEAEQERGLDCIEDLASPGVLSWSLDRPATLALRADMAPAWPVTVLAESEAEERAGAPALDHAARQYLARRTGFCTIMAGFPWFTDWGRDSFIALRGLLLTPIGRAATETLKVRIARETRQRASRDLAEQVLLAWSAHVDQGMLPNRFPDGAGPPEYNAVDASLWFVIAVHDLLAAGAAAPVAARLQAACIAILEGYAGGTRFGIGMDTDGLMRAGAPEMQLTWMDAKVGDWVVTPRRGKPVEVQALWINALRIAAAWTNGARWAATADLATKSFLARFPDPDTNGLRDLIDGDPAEEHRVRPNQIFAVGGLPFTIVPDALAHDIVDLVGRRLLTPLGLRTLDPADPAYQPAYRGGVAQRDGAYHQGTAWPWLLGAYVEAWLRVQGDTAEARRDARARFLPPLDAHLQQAGLGHISEVVDGDAPHRPGGCPFQAWSLGEYLRVKAMLSEAPC